MSVVCAQPPFCAPRPVIDLSDGALRDATQRTLETADGDVGSTSPYGIDCEDGVVGAADADPHPDPNPNPNPQGATLTLTPQP